MYWKIFRKILCVILAFSLFGCRSAYNLHLYSKPSGALVKIGSDIRGETPCKVNIPTDSDFIKNHHIDITYLLENGSSITKSYDLRKYKPPNKIATTIGGAIAAPGILALFLTETDEDDQYTSFDKEDSNKTDREIQWIALGLIGLGALICYAFGGDFGAGGHDIYETFEDVDFMENR